MNEMDRQIIGYAADKLGTDRQSQFIRRELDRVALLPEKFGAEYPTDVIESYRELKEGAEGLPEHEYSEALGELMRRASRGEKEWQTIDLADDEVKLAFGKALIGIDLASAGAEVGTQLVTDPSMMGPKERQFYYARIARQMKEALGVDEPEEYDREYLLRLIGDVAAINPAEMNSIIALMQRNLSEFDGKFSDEMMVAIDAFGGGKEGGTFTSLMELQDISEISMEEYGALLGKLQPAEMYFLAHLPFTVKDNAGIEITITVAEVFDFLMSPRGKVFFRMKPYDKNVNGLREYIGWLGDKYPEAVEGLSLTSNYKVADTEGVGEGGWRKAGVLDEGKHGVEGLSGVHIRMGENTWHRIFKLAAAMANTLPGRHLLYRGGAVFGLGPELQKSANALPHYLEAYTLYDAWVRMRFPRFRGMAEYFMGTFPNQWFLPLKGVNVDLADPFHPRDLNERNDGMEVPDGLTAEQRVRTQREILTMFYGVEEDPASTMFEEAVMDVVSAAAGYGIDYKGDRIGRPRLQGQDLINLAWELKGKMDKSLGYHTSSDDMDMETLMQYRTFYPLPPDVIKKRLEHAPAYLQDQLSGYNFKGLVVRLGGEIDPNKDYTSISGMKEVVELMGNGWWTRPNWGTTQKNATEKHAGYEENMMELYTKIRTMAVGSTQARLGEAQEKAGESIAYGHQDLEERTVKAIDRAWNKLKDIQADPKLRGASLEEFYGAYAEAIQLAGFMSNMRGIWWIYRYAWKRVEYMAGKANSAPYISGTQPAIEVKGEVRHNPVTPGHKLAVYKDYFENILKTPTNDLETALAILGCNIDNEEIVYPARAAVLAPIAMGKDSTGKVICDTRRVNTAKIYGHMRQLPQNPDKMIEIIREGLWDLVRDLLIDVKSQEPYYNHPEYPPGW